MELSTSILGAPITRPSLAVPVIAYQSSQRSVELELNLTIVILGKSLQQKLVSLGTVPLCNPQLRIHGCLGLSHLVNQVRERVDHPRRFSFDCQCFPVPTFDRTSELPT